MHSSLCGSNSGSSREQSELRKCAKNQRFGRLVENRCQACLNRCFQPIFRCWSNAFINIELHGPNCLCTGTRTAAAVESRLQRGCCNRRLSCLLCEIAKIYFRTYSRNKHESLQSKQQPIVDKSAETPPAERVLLSAQHKGTRTAGAVEPIPQKISAGHKPEQ